MGRMEHAGRRRRFTGPLIALLLVVVAGVCAAVVLAAGPGSDSGPTLKAGQVLRTGGKGPPTLPATVVRAPSSPAAATEALGLDLLGKLPAGNAVISPDSIATALAMAGTGARGKTLDQIAEVLHLGEAPLTSLGALQKQIAKDSAQVKIANGLFVQSGFSLKPEFVGGLRKSFGAAPESLDFAADPRGSVEAINAWTGEHTEGLITELFSELPAETRLVLANAVYLKALWAHKFDPYETMPGKFHAAGGTVTAQFMGQDTELPYAAGPGYKAIELPYRGSGLSMLVVLPVGGDVGKLEGVLAATGIEGVVRNLHRGGERGGIVSVSLPKFQLETRVGLVKTLSALGMPLGFSEAADFSGITAAERLHIGAVEHVAEIKVEEKGTEAAAATGTGVVATSLQLTEKHFDANRPFLFFVRDDKTGAVLFAGRLTNPANAATE
jgi:serpin B